MFLVANAGSKDSIIIQCFMPNNLHFSAYCIYILKQFKFTTIFFMHVPVIWLWKDTDTVLFLY
jgi:hypothetical protein